MSSSNLPSGRFAARTNSRPRAQGDAFLWAARAGAAGLLCWLALASAVGVLPTALHVKAGNGGPTAAVTASIVVLSWLPLRRLLVPMAGAVAAASGMVAAAGAMAALAGQRVPSLLATQWRLGGTDGRPAVVALDAALAVAALCIALACLPAVPVLGRGGDLPLAGRALTALTVAALAGWAFALPVTLAARAMRGSPAALSSRAAAGLPADLESGLTSLFRPLAGEAAAASAAGWLVLAGCLSAALVAFSGTAEVATARIAARRSAPARTASLATALISALVLTGVALAGPRTWIVLPLGAAAATAFAIGTAGPGEGERAPARRMNHAARALSARALPALAETLEARANGAGTSPVAAPSLESALAELEATTRHLEAPTKLRRGEVAELARALAEAARQVSRLASGLEAMSRADDERLEELVGQRTAALSNANRHLVDSGWRRRQLLDRAVKAAEGERARLAANLHDGPVQRLAAIGLILDRSRLRLDREDCAGAAELVERARSGLGEEVRGLRQIMTELRPPVLDQGGLEEAVRDHVNAWSKSSGVQARLELAERPKLSPESETVAYRVVQEALANVAKHADARNVLVSIEGSGGGAQVVVRDDGHGFRELSQPDLVRSGHFGLVIMRERVELASGKFEVKSAPLDGTEVKLWLPAVAVDGAPARTPDLSGHFGAVAEVAPSRPVLSSSVAP